MYDNMNMSGKARGYKQAGKKLLCRDAGELQIPGRNKRERNRYVAGERKHNQEVLEHFLGGPDKSELLVEKCRAALSTRRAKRVERLFYAMFNGDHGDVLYKAAFQMLGNAMWRYFAALDNDRCAKMAEAADDQLLRYARG